MNKKLVRAIDLKPGMVCLDMGYTDIILTVDYDSVLINNIHLKILKHDGTIGNWSFPMYSRVTIYDPS